MGWIIRKQTGEPVYAAVLDGKRVGWSSEKAARARLAELELYYMWAFDSVVEEVRDDVEAVADEADGVEAHTEGSRGAEEPVIGAAEAEGGR